MSADYNLIRSKVFELCRASKYSEALVLCLTYVGEPANKEEETNISLLIPYILECEGRLFESREALQSIIDANKSHRGALDHMIQILIKLGEFKQAMSKADQLIEVDSMFPYQSFTSSAYFLKAYSAWKSGQLKEAKAALEKSKETGPIWIEGTLISKEQLAAKISL